LGGEATGFALPGGLRLRPGDRRAAALAVIAAILGVTGWIVLLDTMLFRAVLPADYVAHYTAPLWPRMGLASLGSLAEELVFRLGLMTALVWLVARWRGTVSPAWFLFAIAAAQLANVSDTLQVAPLYGVFRFWLVGCVWGWLYWRHGFASALAGHGLCHFALDPVLQVLLRG
jgi:hypothetical protein